MYKFSLFLLVAATIAPSYAVETKVWSQSEQGEFEKGKLKNLSVRSDGRLSLAPAFKELFDSSIPYLWALAEDSKGNLYAGGAAGASGVPVFIVEPNGKSRKLAELEGLEVHALAVDRRDNIYAATAPDGKVYKITAAGKADVFYDPKAKYIWGLAFNSKGELYVATGDSGEIHRVAPDGKGSVFFETEETHVRSLAVDAKDNLIVGTEPGGLILRVSPAAQGFVLHQADKSEITAVAVAKDGAIYAAGIGNKRPSSTPMMPPPVKVVPVQPAGGSAASQAGPQVRPGGQPAPQAMGPAPSAISGGSEVYRIDPDGFARRIWSHAQDIVYAIGFDGDNRPLVGTGNKGNIYRLDSDILHTTLLNVPPTQVTGLHSGREGRLYAVTGNIGKVYQIGPGLEKTGWIESDVLDASYFSYWGRLAFRAENNGGSLAFETRSGNLDRPQKNWSPWAPVKVDGDGGRIQSPPARFLQWKASITSSPNSRSPEVHWVDAAYLSRNIAPAVQEIEITPANYRFPAQSLVTTPSRDITLQPMRQKKRSSSTTSSIESGSQSMQYAKGHLGARWAVADDNGDRMNYKLEYRGVRESEWKLLKDDLSSKQLSWDATAFPDGEYVVRVTASDAPGNPPGQALTADLVSEPFVIDNTAPTVSGLTANAAGNKINVRWKASDALSIIEKAEYSVNGGEWLHVLPDTRLADSREHSYELVLEKQPGEQTIAIRVTDEFDNQNVAKTVVR